MGSRGCIYENVFLGIIYIECKSLRLLYLTKISYFVGSMYMFLKRILLSLTSIILPFFSEGILYPCDDDVAREETVGNASGDGISNDGEDDSVEIRRMYGTDSETNTDMVHSKVMIS